MQVISKIISWFPRTDLSKIRREENASDCHYQADDCYERRKPAAISLMDKFPPVPARDSLQAGVGMVKDGRYSEACVLFSEVLKLDPKCANALAWRGCAKRMLREDHAALDDLDRALMIEPTNRLATLNRVVLTHRMDAGKSALVCLAPLLDGGKHLSDPFAALCRAIASPLEESEDLLWNIVSDFPKYTPAWESLSSLYATLRVANLRFSLDKAVLAANRTLAVSPACNSAKYLRGAIISDRYPSVTLDPFKPFGSALRSPPVITDPLSFKIGGAS